MYYLQIFNPRRFDSCCHHNLINKKMERTLKEKVYSYAGLFQHVGKGNRLHVPLDCYTVGGVQVECTRQNRYVGCDRANNKFTTNTTEKEGYITIFQRY